MTSVHEWEEIVAETRSAPIVQGVAKYESVKINIQHNDDYIRVLRVDFWDAFYVEEFYLIQIQTGQDIKPRGINAGDKFRNRWFFQVSPGEYQVVTKGRAHKYSVSLLRSDKKLPDPVECTAENSISVILRLPAKYELIPKLISYKTPSETNWKTEIKLEVDPAEPIEVKAQLIYLKDVLVSDYSPTVSFTGHQTWIDHIQPDFYLFDAALWFCFPSKYCDSWRYEPCISPELVVKLPDKQFTFTNTIFRSQTETIDATELFEQLTEDTPIEWQLRFVKSHGKQFMHSSKIYHFVLTKREKFPGIEFFRGIREMELYPVAKLILTPSGNFLFAGHVKGHFNITLRDNKHIVKLFPKYRDDFDGIEYGSNETILVPEILAQIFEHCRLSTDKYCKDFVLLAIVCKYWFNIFKRVMRLEGEYMPMPQDYYKRWQLNIEGWGLFK